MRWLVLISALIAAPVAAQPSEPGRVPLERFRLSTDRSGIGGAESATVEPHLATSAALWVGVADDLLRARNSAGSSVPLVHRRVSGALQFSLPLFDSVSLAVELPVIVHQSRSRDVGEFATTRLASLDRGLGDLRFVGKASLLQQERHRVSLALVGELTIPLGDAEHYLREREATFAPHLVLGWTRSGVRLLGSVGYRQRRGVDVLGTTLDDEYVVRFGAAYRLDAVPFEVWLDSELSISAHDPFESKAQSPWEARVGVLYESRFVAPFAALGLGILRGVGTPDWRLLAGVRVGRLQEDYPNPDFDGDGILDDDDECIEELEDEDGFEDDDGCPDLDDNNNGILDADEEDFFLGEG